MLGVYGLGLWALGLDSSVSPIKVLGLGFLLGVGLD